MPIHVPIYVNDTLVKTYHIARVEGNTNPDSINTYLIIQDDQIWQVGKKFTHRYGDSIETCITLGLSAMMDT